MGVGAPSFTNYIHYRQPQGYRPGSKTLALVSESGVGGAATYLINTDEANSNFFTWLTSGVFESDRPPDA